MTPPRFDIGTDSLTGGLPGGMAGLLDADPAVWPWIPAPRAAAEDDSPMADTEAGRRTRQRLAAWIEAADLPGI